LEIFFACHGFQCLPNFRFLLFGELLPWSHIASIKLWRQYTLLSFRLQNGMKLFKTGSLNVCSLTLFNPLSVKNNIFASKKCPKYYIKISFLYPFPRQKSIASLNGIFCKIP
jgi:hypothetical protein